MDIRKANVVHKIREERLKGGCRIKIHYFINLDKKITICKLIPYTVEYNGNSSKYTMLTEDFFDECNYAGATFTGKAVCVDGDTFHVDFGMKLAYDKAMFKLLTSKKRFFKHIIKCLEKEIEDINKGIERIDKAYEQVTRRYDAKIKEVTK